MAADPQGKMSTSSVPQDARMHLDKETTPTPTRREGHDTSTTKKSDENVSQASLQPPKDKLAVIPSESSNSSSDEGIGRAKDTTTEPAGASAEPPVHHTPARTRTRSLVDAKAPATQSSVNPRLANLRSRADWKQATSISQRLEAAVDVSDAAVPSSSVVSTFPPLQPPPTAESPSSEAPGSSLGNSQLASGGAGGNAPLELPAPIPPHPYPAIPHPLHSNTQGPEFSPPNPPSIPGPLTTPPAPSSSSTPRPIAPRAPTSPSRSMAGAASTSTAPAAGSSSSLPRPHVCPLCQLAFARAHDLKRHGATHTGEKKFKCNACGKAYGRKDALKRHACAAAHAGEFFPVHPNVGGPSSGVQIINGNGAVVSIPPQPGIMIPEDVALASGVIPGRTRGQFQAPPIVGAAASMLAPGAGPSTSSPSVAALSTTSPPKSPTTPRSKGKGRGLGSPTAQMKIKEIKTAEDYRRHDLEPDEPDELAGDVDVPVERTTKTSRRRTRSSSGNTASPQRRTGSLVLAVPPTRTETHHDEAKQGANASDEDDGSE
ncbi:hypothetical protein FS837_004168 [Tulasnella sp. UAMH 9824]|nr:hypothetical protein FS837_004168 [Tulasnella sp. UAMH 9824]